MHMWSMQTPLTNRPVDHSMTHPHLVGLGEVNASPVTIEAEIVLEVHEG